MNMCKSKEKIFTLEFIIKELNMMKDEMDIAVKYMPDFDGKEKYRSGVNMAKQKIDNHLKTYKQTFEENFEEEVNTSLRYYEFKEIN